ncbi:MAG: hypothetical protein FWE70_08120 [Oscillospiraceae bacterium]|nr:hypothetical protein [Oscillospiraceae bacterium]
MGKGMDMFDYKLCMDSLTVFRDVLSDKAVFYLYDFVSSCHMIGTEVEEILFRYGDFLYFLSKGNDELSLPGHVVSLIEGGDNILSRAAASLGEGEAVGEPIAYAARHDLGLLQTIASISPEAVREQLIERSNYRHMGYKLIEGLPSWNMAYTNDAIFSLRSGKDWGDSLTDLVGYYRSLARPDPV